jgi:hypothetical protein
MPRAPGIRRHAADDEHAHGLEGKRPGLLDRVQSPASVVVGRDGQQLDTGGKGLNEHGENRRQCNENPLRIESSRAPIARY